jgi:hypothetical protein
MKGMSLQVEKREAGEDAQEEHLVYARDFSKMDATKW